MRQRTTYLLPQDTGIDPASIEVGANHLNFTKSQDAALEKRVTVDVSELPPELRTLFQDSHELHIRWSAPTYHNPVSPVVSRLPCGLHVFFTARHDQSNPNICPVLKEAFGKDVKCDSIAQSFSKQGVASSPAYQYFHPLPDVRKLQAYLRALPSCVNEGCAPPVDVLDPIDSLSLLDIDFDVVSHAVTFTTYRHATNRQGKRKSQGIDNTVRLSRSGDSVEVGVLQVEKPDDDELESLKLGGYLTVLGENDRPSATLFSFPSRHHQLPASSRTSFRATFQQPTGLHPKLDVTLQRKRLAPPAQSCALYTYLTLPSALFVDRYQLSDPLFLASQHLLALRSLSGEEDLEAPDWVIKLWGSAALFELVRPPPSSEPPDDKWTVTLPLHLRYLSSNASSETDQPGQASLDVPWPVVFWACEAEEGLKMSTNPFDRVNLGYDGLFAPETMFFHVPPAVEPGDELVERLSVPVLEPTNAVLVQVGTLLAVFAGFAWVCWKLVRGSMRVEMEKGKME